MGADSQWGTLKLSQQQKITFKGARVAEQLVFCHYKYNFGGNLETSIWKNDLCTNVLDSRA